MSDGKWAKIDQHSQATRDDSEKSSATISPTSVAETTGDLPQREIGILVDMGFSPSCANQALRGGGGTVGGAMEWLANQDKKGDAKRGEGGHKKLKISLPVTPPPEGTASSGQKPRSFLKKMSKTSRVEISSPSEPHLFGRDAGRDRTLEVGTRSQQAEFSIPGREDENQLTPAGAVAVPGSESLRESADSIIPDQRVPYSDDSMPEISAYVVEDDSMSPEQRRENIRREVLSEAVEAKEVVPARLNRHYYTLAGIATALITGLVVGITVPLVRKSGSSGAVVTQILDDDVIAFVESRYVDSWGLRGFASVELRFIDFANVTTGYAGNVLCRVHPCIEDHEACGTGNDIYEPGCCLGLDCDEETKCGGQCPSVPETCYLTDPSNIDCHSKDCYTCYQVAGQDFWVLSDRVWSIDCLKVGTAIREENGEKYKWAIICGSTISGADEQANFGLGEYACQAFRTGAGFTHEDGGIIAPWGPCQFISLGECGCAPTDVYTFGLSPPSGPCLPEGNCTFLCSDAGKEHARNLCHAFPGDIKWFEGANFMNFDLFTFQMEKTIGSVDIFMKSED